VLDVKELKDAVSMVMPFAKDSGNVVRFSFSGGVLQVSAQSAEVGGRTVEMPVSVEGEADNGIALNGLFVLDLLGALDTDTVTLAWRNRTTPSTFTNEDGTVLSVIMPMSLPNR
jgi:DNA polymerase-3 subunit beta